MSCHQYCKFWENRKFFLVVWFPTDGKKALVTVPFPVFVYCRCHSLSPFSFIWLISTSLGILSYMTGPSSTAASFASLSTSSFPSIPACPLTQPKCIIHFKCFSAIILSLIYSLKRFRLKLFFSKSKVILLSVYIATRLSLPCPSWSSSNFSKTFKIAICSAWLLEQCPCSLNFSWCTNFPLTNIIPAAPTLSQILLPSVYTSVIHVLPLSTSRIVGSSAGCRQCLTSNGASYSGLLIFVTI